MNEDIKIMGQIAELREEHTALDKALSNPKAEFDQLRLQRLKKRKLWLKDEIARLQSCLHPDMIA